MIQFENVTVAFNEHKLLDDVSFLINDKEFVSLVGETGAGKTTILRLLYFDLLPAKGTVTVGMFSSARIRKKEIPQLRQTLGVAFQDFKLFDDRNVFDNVALPLQILGRKKDIILEQVTKALTDTGMLEKRDSMAGVLSGGEQQRVALARALVNQPDIILVDEPTGNLDSATALGIFNLLKQINQTGTTIVMASHNNELVKQSGGRTLHVKAGKVNEIVVK